jgi:hypothetical protein
MQQISKILKASNSQDQFQINLGGITRTGNDKKKNVDPLYLKSTELDNISTLLELL